MNLTAAFVDVNTLIHVTIGSLISSFSTFLSFIISLSFKKYKYNI